eukprot:2826353-Amphidinium_carterae.1
MPELLSAAAAESSSGIRAAKRRNGAASSHPGNKRKDLRTALSQDDKHCKREPCDPLNASASCTLPSGLVSNAQRTGSQDVNSD